MKKIIGLVASVLFCIIFSKNIYAARESTIEFEVKSTDGQGPGALLDGDRKTGIFYQENVSLIITASDKIYGLYLEWLNDVVPYVVEYNGIVKNSEPNMFMHQFINIENGATEIKITLKGAAMLANLYAFENGNVPKEIQYWQPPCEKADMLVLSTHADDEILFLGGVLAEYAGERNLEVQMVYFFDYSHAWSERQHEILDGLWAIGVKHYPENGGFREGRVGSVDECKEDYGYDNSIGFMTKMIRKYKPLVCVTQDVNGEYGQVHHKFVVDIFRQALEASGDSARFPETVEQYGVYDVPKAYIHLWPENPIKLDTRKALTAFDGKNAFEVASDAYKKHETQQKLSFYVSDTGKYSIADFGLYRTKVGLDTGNDMMENVQKAVELETEEPTTELETTTQEVITTVATTAPIATEIESTDVDELDNEQRVDEKKAIAIITIASVVCVTMVTFLVVILCKRNKKQKGNRK